MKLYRHYKNKLYKFLQVAKHSETLDDMVIYECLHENILSTVWARPKDLFHGKLELDGKLIPRFSRVELKIHEFEVIGAPELSSIAELMKLGFGEWNSKWFHNEFSQHKIFFLVLGYLDGINFPVGFKIGFESTADCFYSWLGAVIPEYRGLGIATELMKTQHVWCRSKGYKKVQTKSQNRFKNMVILNLNNGFDIVDTQPSNEGGLKILMEKAL